MPKRRRVTRFESSEVQGEGSFVVCSTLTVAEQRDARQFMADGGDAFELGIQILRAHVLSWNWVDDEGEDLPQPKAHPEVIEALTDAEVGFLSTCIKGSEAAAKN